MSEITVSEEPNNEVNIEANAVEATASGVDPTKWWKCLIVCCDGTGQAASHGKSVVPTNVARFARALSISPKWQSTQTGEVNETQQIVLYQSGVGTDAGLSKYGATVSETTGSGLDIHVLEAYHFFVNNYEEGDKLFLFGFSRGAYTARAIASFIVNVGLLKKEHIEVLPPIYEAYKTHFRPDRRREWLEWLEDNRERITPLMAEDVVIPVMGLWDTVGSLGLPETQFSRYFEWTGIRKRFNERYAFHDMSLKQHGDGRRIGAQIQRAYQALALDEHRISFGPTLLWTCEHGHPADDRAIAEELPDPVVEQCWFPGEHTDVGGGWERGHRDVSDLSLVWMMDKCRDHLRFNIKPAPGVFEYLQTPSQGFKGDSIQPVPLVDIKKQPLVENDWGCGEIHDGFTTLVWTLGGSRTRTPGEYYLGMKDHHDASYKTYETVHPSVRLRIMENCDPRRPDKWIKYLPPALQGFRLEKENFEKDGKTLERWVWIKDVISGGETYTIRIPEYQFLENKWEEEFLAKDASDPATKLRNPKAGDMVNLSLEALKPKNTMMHMAMTAVPFIGGLVVIGSMLHQQIFAAYEYAVSVFSRK